MRTLRAQKSGAPILAHRTANSTCPVCTGHPGGPTSQKLQRSESNGSDDVAGGTGLSGVHRTVRCAIEQTAVTPGFRRQTECEPCTCQDQLFTYTAVT